MGIPLTTENGWDEVARLTESMLMHAVSGEWEQVILIESDRQILMRHFFEQNSIASFASDIADGISQIMETDRKIMRLGKTGLNQMSKHLQAINTGKQATDAYKTFS